MTASFISQDPIGLLDGLNPYRYVPNPVGWVDPLGLSCKETYGSFATKIDSQVYDIEHEALPDWVAESFTNSDYRTVETSEPITLIRVYGGNTKATGAFATTVPATNKIQAKIDAALLPE